MSQLATTSWKFPPVGGNHPVCSRRSQDYKSVQARSLSPLVHHKSVCPSVIHPLAIIVGSSAIFLSAIRPSAVHFIDKNRFPMSSALERVRDQTSERISAAEHASKASSVVHTNEWAVRTNERMSERMAHQSTRQLLNFIVILPSLRWSFIIDRSFVIVRSLIAQSV